MKLTPNSKFYAVSMYSNNSGDLIIPADKQIVSSELVFYANESVRRIFVAE